jgi:hypothetical protein
MYNPFAKPVTLYQFLVSSLCWVGGCLGGFEGVLYGTNIFLPRGDAGAYPIFGSAILICGLMWSQVIAIGWHLVGEEEVSVIKAITSVWLLLLTVLLVISGLLILVGIIIII